ncbi:hypothetical protein [Acidisoma cladoniae]|uniref:hypothetical protein n=1 Tax=Acidisoma cladoniae TaxID=3040935 RepID=UPI00254D4B09|nr:hypothetical protein [Acidisoma sp. PAMC 29798]
MEVWNTSALKHVGHGVSELKIDFGPGNPQLSSLMAVLQALKQEFSVGLTVQTEPIQHVRKATKEAVRPALPARARRRAAA